MPKYKRKSNYGRRRRRAAGARRTTGLGTIPRLRFSKRQPTKTIKVREVQSYTITPQLQHLQASKNHFIQFEASSPLHFQARYSQNYDVSGTGQALVDHKVTWIAQDHHLYGPHVGSTHSRHLMGFHPSNDPYAVPGVPYGAKYNRFCVTGSKISASIGCTGENGLVWGETDPSTWVNPPWSRNTTEHHSGSTTITRDHDPGSDPETGVMEHESQVPILCYAMLSAQADTIGEFTTADEISALPFVQQVVIAAGTDQPKRANLTQTYSAREFEGVDDPTDNANLCGTLGRSEGEVSIATGADNPWSAAGSGNHPFPMTISDGTSVAVVPVHPATQNYFTIGFCDARGDARPEYDGTWLKRYSRRNVMPTMIVHITLEYNIVLMEPTSLPAQLVMSTM